jgi:phytoene dehydrogenase-like protein
MVARRGGEREAVVVGAGPNGLVAAITLARAGWKVTVFEAAAVAGGGLRSEALTLPGYVHDVCAAVLALGVASPALSGLPLADHGVRFVHADVPLAHPLDGGRAAVVQRTVDATAATFGPDGPRYRAMFGPLVEHADAIVEGILSPLRAPRSPLTMARFAQVSLRAAAGLARSRFSGDQAAAILVGTAAHSMVSLTAPGTAGFGVLLTVLGHRVGFPVVEGGSQRLAEALVAILRAGGGDVVTDHPVRSLSDLPPADAVLLDLTPRQVVTIAGDRLPARYARALGRFRYGPGVFKLDYALDGPVPWTAPAVGTAATVHLGGTATEIVAAEGEVVSGRHPARPYVIVVQPTVADPTRAPAGKHVVWAYCHVPHGSDVDMTVAVERQFERFAPGFRDRVLARHVMGPAAMEAHNANHVGGDINGGSADLRQLFTRPVASLRPWATPVRGLYLCSSSTPPGGGVHGMGGWHAALTVLRAHPA